MKIFCGDSKRDINKRECFPDRKSHACKICPHKKAKNINKDIYRNKPCTTQKKKNITIDKEYQHRLKIIQKSNKPLYNLINKIKQDGANLNIILQRLSYISNPDEYNKRVKAIKNKLKSISGRFYQTITIDPIPNLIDSEKINQFNKVLKLTQLTLEGIRPLYLKLLKLTEIKNLPDGMLPMGLFPRVITNLEKKKDFTSIQLNIKIYDMVDELCRIYSNNRAYEITGILLNLSFPNYYKDPDPAIVRQRYTYYKNKSST